MKKLKILSVVLFVQACISDKAEDPIADCQESNLTISIENVEEPECNSPGSISVSGSGGDQEYTYSINNGNFRSSGIFENLNPGTYQLTIMDGIGCTASEEVELGGNNALRISVSVSGCASGEGELTVNATGGDGNYNYQLNDQDFVDSNQFSGLVFGEYDITVKDGEGCTVSSNNIRYGVSLNQDVVPIIETNCALSGCHLDSQTPLLVTNNDIISAAGQIKSETVAGTMPPTGGLSENEIQLIADWVDCGAQNN